MKMAPTVLIALLVLAGSCPDLDAAAAETGSGPVRARAMAPLCISNVMVSGVNDSSAVIAWETNYESDSEVEYGLNASYGSRVNDSASVTSHSVVLSNLTGSTKYHFRVLSRQFPGEEPTRSEDFIFITTATPDIQPPRIFDFRIEDITDTQAVVTWTTDEPANSALEYGVESGYGHNVTDPAYLLHHSIAMRNLTPSTTYHFRVLSTDLFGNGPNLTGDMNFTTSLHTSPPAIVIVSPANGTSCANATLEVRGTAMDDFAIARVELSVNQGPWMAVSGIGAWSCNVTLEAGQNTIVVRAADAYGNVNTTRIILSMGGRSPVPAVEIFTQRDGQTVTTERLKLVSGTVNSSSPIKMINVTVNGIPVPVEQSGNNWSARDVQLKEGKNVIAVHAVDDSGNDVSAKISVNYAKPKPQPGSEALFLVAAVALAMSIIAGKRRNISR